MIFSFPIKWVQMQFSHDWIWTFSSVEGVLKSEKQAASDEIILRSLRLNPETQEHWEDRTWISCPWYNARYLFWLCLCVGLKRTLLNIYRTIFQMDHICKAAHMPRKSPGHWILEQQANILRQEIKVTL